MTSAELKDDNNNLSADDIKASADDSCTVVDQDEKDSKNDEDEEQLLIDTNVIQSIRKELDSLKSSVKDKTSHVKEPQVNAAPEETSKAKTELE